MRYAATRVLVVALIWMLTPGLTESAENLLHLLGSGHVAHALSQGPDHEPMGDEHGCSGTFHVCSCHQTLPTALAVARATQKLTLQTMDSTTAGGSLFEGPDLPGLYRPPKG